MGRRARDGRVMVETVYEMPCKNVWLGDERDKHNKTETRRVGVCR